MSVSMPTLESEEISIGRMEVSVRGKWVTVPAVGVCGNQLAVMGKWVRVASLHDEEWLESEIANPEVCIRELKQMARPCADIFTFIQKLPAVDPKYDYSMERVSLAVAEVGDFKTWWEALPQETRKNVRRAEKRGVVIRVQEFNDDLVRGIAEVQNETPERQGRRYPHYGKTFEQVKRDHSGFVERSDFICAYVGDDFVGFLKLVYRGDIASILQLNSKMSHYDKRPSNALLAKAVELCASKGITHLTYGKFNYGNKNDSSLKNFKIRNGFHETLMPRFYIPLTTWGKFCVRTRLYRGAMDFLPPSVIAGVARARSKWYDLKTNFKGPV